MILNPLGLQAPEVIVTSTQNIEFLLLLEGERAEKPVRAAQNLSNRRRKVEKEGNRGGRDLRFFYAFSNEWLVFRIL